MPLYDKIEQMADSPSPINNTMETATVYDEKKSLATTTQIDGTPWPVTWYSQAMLADDEPKQLDMLLDPSLQQYVRINNFIIMLQDDGATSSTDTTQVISTVSGSAIIYPGVTPNKGDHFTARMPDGRIGLYVIKDWSELGYLSYSAWNIEYELFDYHSDKYQDNLDKKTIQVLAFDANNAGCPGAANNDDTVKQMGALLARLVGRYYDEFFDKLTLTFLFPHEGSRQYDPLVVEFWLSIIDRPLRGMRPLPIAYDVPSTLYKREDRSIWGALLTGEWYIVESTDRFVNDYASTSFHSAYMLYGPAASHIDSIVIPSKEGTLRRQVETTPSLTYVFSEFFYKGEIGLMSKIEQMTHKALNFELISQAEIKELVTTLDTHQKEVRFYRIPVIIWLIKYFIRKGMW